jgi:hypothetical protein
MYSGTVGLERTEVKLALLIFGEGLSVVKSFKAWWWRAEPYRTLVINARRRGLYQDVGQLAAARSIPALDDRTSTGNKYIWV